MKKFLNIFSILLAVVCLTGCEKEKVGNTAVVELAGEWYVTVDAVDAQGEVVMDDPFGLGEILILTYNEYSNDPTKLVVDDLEGFWAFQAVVSADIDTKTFAGTDVIYQDEDGDVTATLSNGKITVNGALSPVYKRPIDAIEFDISFSDDPYPPAYGYDHYHIHGWRRTGFAAED